MSMQDDVVAAQAKVDAANAKRAADEAADTAEIAAAQAELDAANAKLAAIQPHLDLIGKVRAELQSLKTDASDAVAKVEGSIEPLLDEIVALFSAG